MKQPIAIIYMGGTVGCTGTPLTPLNSEKFIHKLQQIIAYPNPIGYFHTPKIADSASLNLNDWFQLAHQILKISTQYKNIIVLHGTDTLCYAAAFIHYLFADTLNIIFTGSQRPLLDVNAAHVLHQTDALENIYFSLNATQMTPNGCYLAFNHTVFHANHCLKIDTVADAAFLGVEHIKPVAKITPFSDWQLQNEPQLQRLNQLNIISLMLLPQPIQRLEQHLAMILSDPPDVLILQAFGSGNFEYTSTIVQLFSDLTRQKCLVLISSQVHFGTLNSNYQVASWLKHSTALIVNATSPADLYAKVCISCMQYPDFQTRWNFWSEQLCNATP